MKKLAPPALRKYGKIQIQGLALVYLATIALTKIWVSEKDLLCIKGQVSSADYYVTKVSDRHGRQSYVSEVIFYLYSTDYKFVIEDNTDRNVHSKRHQKLQQQLRQADSAEIWIKKSDINDFEPEIFRLHADGKELICLNDVKAKYKAEYFIFMVPGIVVLLLPFIIRHLSGEKTTAAGEGARH